MQHRPSKTIYITISNYMFFCFVFLLCSSSMQLNTINLSIPTNNSSVHTCKYISSLVYVLAHVST